MSDSPRRGDIWLVRLDPTIGSEIKKTRPAFIISNDTNNQYSPFLTILPISEKGEKVYPFEVTVSISNAALSKPSKIRCQQIRTVDKERLMKRLGVIPKKLLPDIEEALKLHLDIQ